MIACTVVAACMCQKMYKGTCVSVCILCLLCSYYVIFGLMVSVCGRYTIMVSGMENCIALYGGWGEMYC